MAADVVIQSPQLVVADAACLSRFCHSVVAHSASDKGNRQTVGAFVGHLLLVEPIISTNIRSAAGYGNYHVQHIGMCVIKRMHKKSPQIVRLWPPMCSQMF